MRHALVALAGAVVVAAIVVAARDTFDAGALLSSLAGAHLGWVLVSCALYLLSLVLLGQVWGCALRASLGTDPPTAQVQRAHWLSRAGAEVVPTPVADGIRVAALRRVPEARGRTSAVVGSIGGFRLVDGVVGMGSALLLALVVPLPADLAALRWGAAAGLVVCVGAALAVVALDRRWVGRHPGGRTARIVRDLLRGARVFGDRRDLARALLLQTLTALARVASVVALCLAFGLPARAAAVAYLVATVASVVAITPGGVGVRELALVPLLMSAFGTGTEVALALSLSLQGTGTVVALLGAAVMAVAVRPGPAPEPPATTRGPTGDGATLEPASGSG